MGDEKKGLSIDSNIGNVSGGSQVAVGSNISQVRTQNVPPNITEADRAALRQLFDDLKTKVEMEAPPEEKGKALERVDELKEAVNAKKPEEHDLTTMEYVRNWFVKHLPSVAGSVTSLIVHPLVGKLVEVGGDALASSFRKRFGIPDKSS
jgi:hypothetical protein